MLPIVLLILLVSCSPRAQEQRTSSELLAEHEAASQATETVRISGTIKTIEGHPIRGTFFYLTPAPEGNGLQPPLVVLGAQPERGDIVGTTGDDGAFALDALAGDYQLVVWAPFDWCMALESAADASPRIIRIEPGDDLDLGAILVPWP